MPSLEQDKSNHPLCNLITELYDYRDSLFASTSYLRKEYRKYLKMHEESRFLARFKVSPVKNSDDWIQVAIQHKWAISEFRNSCHRKGWDSNACNKHLDRVFFFCSLSIDWLRARDYLACTKVLEECVEAFRTALENEFRYDILPTAREWRREKEAIQELIRHVKRIIESLPSLADGSDNHLPLKFNEAESLFVEALREAGHRMTGEELQMKARGIVISYGQSHLSSLVRQGILTNNKYANPRGYGLTEWDK